MSSAGQTTNDPAAIDRGEEQFLSAVYDEMHSLASRYMRRERSDHTLQPTALVNETYLRLLRLRRPEFQDRTHFFATAAVIMRRVLVDHARQRAAARRARGIEIVPFPDVLASVEPHIQDLLILDDALNKLSELDSRQARVVELIYFGGLTEYEVAGILEVSVRTVRRDWRSARAWLQVQLGRTPS